MLAFCTVMYFKSRPLTSYPGVWGRCKSSVGPVQSSSGGPGGEAPGSSENTVIYSKGVQNPTLSVDFRHYLITVIYHKGVQNPTLSVDFRHQSLGLMKF